MIRLTMSYISRLALPIVMALVVTLAGRAQVIEHKLTASDGAAEDIFGSAVSIDGDRALVGAHHADEEGQPVTYQSGSAYVYERQLDGSWIEVARLNDSGTDRGDSFGRSVSLSGDRALIGAYHDEDPGGGMSTGSAYIFERQEDGSWLEVAKLLASDGEEADLFGRSSRLVGNRAIIGAAGSPMVGVNGSAYIFERQPDGSWLEVAKLAASDGAPFDFFGWSVWLSGNRAIAGAPRDDFGGSAYVFERQPDSTWLEVAKLAASDGVPTDRFGWSVSLSENGALAGAPQLSGTSSGSAYLFERQPNGSWLENKLTPSDGDLGDQFGFSVSLLEDRAVIGARYDDANIGSAYMFERQGDGSWLEAAKLTASDGADGDAFGRAVSLWEDRVLVGAYKDDDVGFDGGSAYVIENLSPPSNLSVTCSAVSPPIVIPAGGGNYAFALDVVNGGAASETFNFWFDIDGPGIQRTSSPVSLNLDAGASLNRTINQNVPAGFPAGTYVHTCSVGTFPTADASSGFDFEKSAAFGAREMIVTNRTADAEIAAALTGEAPSEVPSEAALKASYPNPFNPSTTISFSLPESAQVRLVVFDVLGRQVRVLIDGTREAGTHEVLFDASDLPSGTYLYRLETPQGSLAQTMLLAK